MMNHRKKYIFEDAHITFQNVRLPTDHHKCLDVCKFDICDDPGKRHVLRRQLQNSGINVYLNFDVNVLKHAFSPWIINLLVQNYIKLLHHSFENSLPQSDVVVTSVTSLRHQIDVGCLLGCYPKSMTFSHVAST